MDYLISPVIFTLREFLSADGHDKDMALTKPWPSAVVTAIIVLQLASALAVWLLSRRMGLNKMISILWLFMALLIGLPALLSFMLLNPMRLRMTRFNQCSNQCAGE